MCFSVQTHADYNFITDLKHKKLKKMKVNILMVSHSGFGYGTEE